MKKSRRSHLKRQPRELRSLTGIAVENFNKIYLLTNIHIIEKILVIQIRRIYNALLKKYKKDKISKRDIQINILFSKNISLIC